MVGGYSGCVAPLRVCALPAKTFFCVLTILISKAALCLPTAQEALTGFQNSLDNLPSLSVGLSTQTEESFIGFSKKTADPRYTDSRYRSEGHLLRDENGSYRFSEDRYLTRGSQKEEHVVSMQHAWHKNIMRVLNLPTAGVETGGNPAALADYGNNPEQAKDFFATGLPAKELFGFLPGDRRAVYEQLVECDNVSATADPVDGFSCVLVEGTTVGGTYRLWLDPSCDYLVRRAVIHKSPEHEYYGKALSDLTLDFENPSVLEKSFQRSGPPGKGSGKVSYLSVDIEMNNVTISEIDGRHFIAAASISEIRRLSDGLQWETHGRLQAHDLVVTPDFESLGSLALDSHIPNGTEVYMMNGLDSLPLEWRNGKITPVLRADEISALTGSIQQAKAAIEDFRIDQSAKTTKGSALPVTIDNGPVAAPRYRPIVFVLAPVAFLILILFALSLVKKGKREKQ